MLYRGNVFQLVVHTLHNGSFAQEESVAKYQGQAILGIAFQLGDQLHAKDFQQEGVQILRDAALVAIDFAE